MSSNAAFVHLLTNADYLPGLLVLHRSHLDVASEYPFVVMVTDAVSEEVLSVLRERGMIVRHVDPLRPRQRCSLSSKDSRFSDTWTKLRAFELFEYERVVLRDIDMLLLRNVDDLLEMDLPPNFIAATHVCACNPRRFPHYPLDWNVENCAYTPLSYPGCLSHASQITPQSPRPYGLLNGGIVVLTPSQDMARQISHYLNTSPLVVTFKFPDQDFLAELFRNRWIPLPWTYNALKTLRMVHPEIWRDEDARCVHYIMAEKPWVMPRPPKSTSLATQLILPRSTHSFSSFSSFSISSDSESTGDSISIHSSSGVSTAATSPSASQIDIRLPEDQDREFRDLETDVDFHKAAPGPSWMGESEAELLRWWWTAYDRLEREAGHNSWWSLVEARMGSEFGGIY